MYAYILTSYNQNKNGIDFSTTVIKQKRARTFKNFKGPVQSHP